MAQKGAFSKFFNPLFGPNYVPMTIARTKSPLNFWTFGKFPNSNGLIPNVLLEDYKVQSVIQFVKILERATIVQARFVSF